MKRKIFLWILLGYGLTLIVPSARDLLAMARGRAARTA